MFDTDSNFSFRESHRLMGKIFALTAMTVFLTYCSALKLDPEANCLNDKTACFRSDVTFPQFDPANSNNVPASGAVVSTLGEVRLQFSEELNNPQPGDFTYSEPGLVVQSVEKVDKFTYKLLNNRNPTQGGPLTLSFPNLKDYAGNKIGGTSSISYTINLNIPVTTSATHNGVSTSGFPSLTVSWYFRYIPTLAGNTVYHVRLTTGAEDCSAGSPITPATATPVVNSTVQTYDETSPVTIAATTYTFSVDTAVIIAQGAQKILVCVDNNNNNKHGVGIINIVRDDTAPTVLTLSPAGGNYVAPQALTFNCSDNADKIIFDKASNVGSAFDPVAGDVTEPTFNTSTGAVVSGTLYDPANKPVMPFTSNTTRTIYKYRCIDKAGNIYPPNASAALVSGVYRVNTSYPTVTLSSLTKTAATPAVNITGVGLGGHTSATLQWSTNQVGQAWEIRSGGTDCGVGGTVVASGSGGTATPSPANTPILTNILHTSPGIADQVLNELRVCVTNGSDWGQAGFTLLRDDSAPAAPTVNVPPGDYGTTQNLVFSCSDNEDRVIYTQSNSIPSGVPADPGDPQFDADGRVTFGDVQATYLPVTTDSTSLVGKKTRVKWRCIDKAGHVSSVGDATYTIDTLLPTVTVHNQNRTAVSPAVGAYNSVQITWSADRQISGYSIRRNSTNCSDGNVLSSGTNLSSVATIPAGTQTTSTINGDLTNFPGGNNSYTLHICATNSIGNRGYTTRTLIFDDTNPAIPAPAVSVSQVDATNFTLTWTAATDGGSGIAGYRIFRSLTSGVYGASPDYTASSSPATLAMPDTQAYFLRIVPFDAAGNTPGGAYTEISTKPTITLVVAGLTAGSFTLSDGTVSNTISAITAGSPWTTTLGIGASYAFNVTAQPTGQVCAVRQKQFGTLNANVTINVDCVTGQITAGRFQPLKPLTIKYFLYRGNTQTLASGQTNPNSLAVHAGYLYFGNYLDCDGATAGNQYCLYRIPVNGGAVGTYVTGLAAPVRGVVSDGSNLYFVTENPDNKLYKLPSGSTTPVEIAAGFNRAYGLAIDGNNVYVCSRDAGEIVRVDLATGTQTVVLTGIAGGPLGLTLTASDIYFTAGGQHAIFRVAKSGGASTVAYGSAATAGHRDDQTTSARLSEPHDLAYDGISNIYLAEYTGHRIRRINLTTQRVTTIAGDGTNTTYSAGTGSGARIPAPVGITTDGRSLYVSAHSPSNAVIKMGDRNLVGHWPLNASVDDYSSDGFNGAFALTQNGSFTYANGRYGETSGSHRFDGSNYLSVADQNQYDLFSEWTISLWINRNSSGVMRLVDKITAGQCDGWNFDILSDDRLRLNYCLTNSAVHQLQSARSIGQGEWVHVLATFSATRQRARIYINGHLDAEKATGVGTTLSNTLPVYIGSDHVGGNRFSGAMAEVRIYGRALSEAEINELAQDASGVATVGASFNKGATELNAHYEMNDTTPAGALTQSLSGTYAATTGKDGDTSGAAIFDGTSSLSITGSQLAGLPIGASPRTMCAFVRPTAYPAAGDYNSPVSYGSAGSLNEFGLALSRDAGTNFYVSNTFNSAVDHSVTYKVPLYTWTHLCASYDGTYSRLYVDGVLIGTKTVAINTSIALGTLRVGAWFADTHRFTGQVDDVRVYNKALTQFEIRQIAVQVPSGLVARYDFTGDRDDISGFGQDLSSNGVNLTSDRFAFANAAADFSGSAYFETTMNGFSTGNAARSVCAWARPTSLSASFSRVLMYGTVAISFGVGMDVNRFFSLDGAGDLILVQQPPLNVWRHLCVTHDGSTERLYLDGGFIGSGPKTLTTGTGGVLRIGRAIDITDYFTGAIDDVRIYNRAISQSEVQALVQQPNKKIQLSGPTVQGDMGGSPSGIVGADQRCPVGFKAMIVDGSTRRACTSTNCATSGVAEHINWVLRPNITYMQSAAVLPVFTADWNGVWNFSGTAPAGGNFFNVIYSSSQSAWTGLASDWQVANGGVDLDCSDWGSILSTGAYGRTNGAGSNAIFQSTSLCTDGTNYLYCVEQ